MLNDRLTIIKIPHQVPPATCIYQDGEEVDYRIDAGSEEKFNVCRKHMRLYLLGVAEQLSEE